MAKRPIYEETSEEIASYGAGNCAHLPTPFSISIGQLPCENIIELQYAIYSLFRGNFKGLELREKAYQTQSVELLVPMANGNTGIVTIQSKSKEDMVTYRERGY
jgi:hypothetical protein